MTTLTMNDSVNFTTDRSGAMNLNIKRIGGVPGSSIFSHYAVETQSTGMDVGLTSIISHSSGGATPNGGGVIFGTWSVAIGPTTDEPRGIVGLEVNTVERAKDVGLQTDRTKVLGYSVGIQIVPENQKFLGGEGLLGFNQTYGLCVAQSSLPSNLSGRVRTHIPLFLEKDCTANGGISLFVGGGSTTDIKPRSLLEAEGYFSKGIDLSKASFTDYGGAGLVLGADQGLRLNGASNSGLMRYDNIRQHFVIGTKDSNIYDTYHSFGIRNSPGVYFAWNGYHGGANDWWLDLSGTTDAIASINLSTRPVAAPNNTSLAVKWMRVYVNGEALYMPLYR